jgi:DNA-binding NarL/FixJ family response regulator
LRLLEEAARLRPDAILLDLNMPNMNGLQACEKLRRAVPGSKIIVLTAETDAEVTQRALALGASSVVTKQCVGADLMTAIRLACDDQLA